MATHSTIIAGKSHGQRNLSGYSPRGHRVGHDLATKPPATHNIHRTASLYVFTDSLKPRLRLGKKPIFSWLQWTDPGHSSCCCC